MSAPFVRDAFRAAVPLVLPPDFLFVESINLAERTENLPAQYATLDFLPASNERIALGRPSLERETGTCVVLLYSPQQTGDTETAEAAQLICDAMGNFALGSLRVLDAGPPSDLDGGDFRGSFYGMSVGLRYQWDHFVD